MSLSALVSKCIKQVGFEMLFHGYIVFCRTTKRAVTSNFTDAHQSVAPNQKTTVSADSTITTMVFTTTLVLRLLVFITTVQSLWMDFSGCCDYLPNLFLQ